MKKLIFFMFLCTSLTACMDKTAHDEKVLHEDEAQLEMDQKKVEEDKEQVGKDEYDESEKTMKSIQR